MSDSSASIKDIMNRINEINFDDLSEDSISTGHGNYTSTQVDSLSQYSEDHSESNPFSDYHSDDEKTKFFTQVKEITGHRINNYEDILQELKLSKKQQRNANNSTITSYLSEFNCHFSTKLNSFSGIIDYVQDIVEENQRLRRNSQQISSGYSVSSILDQEVMNQKTKIDELELQLKGAQLTIQSLTKQTSLSSQTKSSYEQAFSNAEELLQNQISETKNLATQRNMLINLLHQLDQVCNELDNRSQSYKQQLDQASLQPPQRIEKEKPVVQIKNNDEETYKLLASTFRIIESTLHPSYLEELETIRDDSDKPVEERLLNIIRQVCLQYQNTNKDSSSLSNENYKLKNEKSQLEKKTMKILHMFEEELKFIQKLTQSKELQEIIFYRPDTDSSIQLDYQAKEELIRRCAAIGTFIDENIGQLCIGTIDEELKPFESLNPTQIFELMLPIANKEKISSIFSHIDENECSISERAIIDILVAQVLMNEIMTTHIHELHSRLITKNLEHNKFEQKCTELAESEKNVTVLTNQLRKMKRKEKRLKQQLMKATDMNEEDDLLSMVNNIVSETKREYQNQSTEANLIQEEKIDNTELIDHYEKKKSKIKKLIKEIQNKQKEIDEKSGMITQLQIQLNNINSKSQEDVQKIEKSFDEQKLKMNDKMNEFAERIQVGQEEIKSLKVKIQKDQDTLSDLKDQFEKSENNNRSLQEKNQQLQLHISHLEDVNLKSIEAIKNKSQALRAQYDSITEETKSLQTTNSALQQTIHDMEANIEQLKSELEKCRITNKALNMTLSANEDKYDQEKKTLCSKLEACKATAKTEMEVIKKQHESELNNLEIQLINLASKCTESDLSDCDGVQAANKMALLIEELRKVQDAYYKILDDVTQAQKLMKIEPGCKISKQIEKTLIKFDQLLEMKSQIESDLHDSKEENIKIRNEFQRIQSQLAALKQWEAWAIRLLRVVRDKNCTTFTNEQLRLALEESILSSVATRSTFFKIELLRDEKKLYQRYDKRILQSKTRNKASFLALVSVVLSTRRLQKLTGYLPIANDSYYKNKDHHKKYDQLL